VRGASISDAPGASAEQETAPTIEQHGAKQGAAREATVAAMASNGRSYFVKRMVGQQKAAADAIEVAEQKAA